MVRCGTCEHCLAEELNLCRKGGDLIGLGRDGGLAEWVDVPVENLVGARRCAGRTSVCSPSRWPSPSAASAWPDLRPDETVLVLGAGTIGLLAALVARAHERARRHLGALPAPGRRGRGARPDRRCPRPTSSPGASKSARRRSSRPSAGRPTRSTTAIRVARRGGRIVVLGTFDKPPVDLLTAAAEGGRDPAVVRLLDHATASPTSTSPRRCSASIAPRCRRWSPTGSVSTTSPRRSTQPPTSSSARSRLLSRRCDESPGVTSPWSWLLSCGRTLPLRRGRTRNEEMTCPGHAMRPAPTSTPCR